MIVPAPGYVVVKQSPKETTSKGGILRVPDDYQNAPLRGKVVAAGEPKDPALRSLDLEEGDDVVYGNAGIKLKIEGEEVVLMSLDNVFARIGVAQR